MDELKGLRDEIDNIDSEILRLLNKRTEIVLKIRKAKKDKRINIHSPQREKEILERLQRLNPGPFPNDALKSIYREILSASLSLDKPLKVSYLGPSATLTHLAARQQFGSSTHYIPESTIKGIFEAVEEGKAQYGVVPIENSTQGFANYTLNMFIDSELKIAAEIMLEISHNLLSRTGRREAEWPCPDPASETVESELTAKTYKLKFIEGGIKDYKYNTCFLVIAKDFPTRTGKDKTSIMFSIKDKPSALYSILRPFARHRVNLTSMESRPSRRRAGEYIFFVDMEGHIEDRRVKNALEEVKKECLYLKVLGSYPLLNIGVQKKGRPQDFLRRNNDRSP